MARAYTGRDLVALCSEHPCFSTNDWFIGTTAINAGIPEAVKQLTLIFRYNDLESGQALFDHYPGQVACLLLEAEKTVRPQNDFLQQAKTLCHQHGALLIFDEIITGFRLHLGGGQKLHGVTPDLCSFGKGIVNGFSVAALPGRRDVMELGGLRHHRERVFLLSTTYGAEYHGLAAAIATMTIYQQEDVIGFVYRQGERLATGIHRSVDENRLGNYFGLLGRYSKWFVSPAMRRAVLRSPFVRSFFRKQ